MTNRIKQLRKEKGLTLKELSLNVGIPTSTISQYENERRKIAGDALKTLSSFFKVPEDYILGAWSEKEVFELMSSSLLDNYKRLFEMAREYGGKGGEWMFFNDVDIISPSPHTMPEEISKYEQEILKSAYMGLAFLLLNFAYEKGAFENLYTPEYFAYDEENVENQKAKIGIILGDKSATSPFFSYSEIKGYENLMRFMTDVLKAIDTKERSKVLSLYLQDKYAFLYERKYVFENSTVKNLMREKASKETMSLALIDALTIAIEPLEYKAFTRLQVKFSKESDKYAKEHSKYIELQNEYKELQEENKRLKEKLNLK